MGDILVRNPKGKEVWITEKMWKDRQKEFGWSLIGKQEQKKPDFICEYCGRKFPMKANLVNHLKTHQAESKKQ